MAYGSVVAAAIVTGATPALAGKNLKITLDNASKYNLHVESASDRTDEYPDEIEKGDTGDITTTHHDGEGVGKITYNVGATTSTYCQIEFKITYSAAIPNECFNVTIDTSTNRSNCKLSKTKSSTDSNCHWYYTFDTD